MHRPLPTNCPWGLANSVLYPTIGQQAPTLGSTNHGDSVPILPSVVTGHCWCGEGQDPQQKLEHVAPGSMRVYVHSCAHLHPLVLSEYLLIFPLLF